ncbi:MAG: ATP-binding protein [Thermofilum sp. ex4484_82]|nr:MAG: ATP-binding protein [Thermofilum sp. ex4484_82]OYT38894.1 MAG: ATP-binding protein [Archaeoglobales archaeon ex4484_92]
MVKIIKVDGSSEEFDKNKIIQSCIKAGATEKAAREIADEVEKKVKEGTRTTQIRRMVLKRLRAKNPEWADNWEFYDRIVKGRVTYEDGKFVVIEKGNLYLGREVRDVGKKGLSSVEEVEGILRELEEDLEAGIPRKTIHNRTYVLFMAVLKTRKMTPEDKLKSIELINKFRQKHGWKPFELKKPIS